MSENISIPEEVEPIVVEPQMPVEPIPLRTVRNSPASGSTALIPIISSAVDKLYGGTTKYLRMGFNSITGTKAVEWNPSDSVTNNLTWFAKIRQRARASDADLAINAAQNALISYAYGTAAHGNAINTIRGQQEIIISRPRSSALQNITLTFSGSCPSDISAADIFAKYYRGVLIDERYVSSDLQGVLRISKSLAGFLTPAVTMGPAENQIESFYAIGWVLFIHRSWFVTNQVEPVLPAIANDSFRLISLDPAVGETANVAREILDVIEAGELIIYCPDYTLVELCIIRLIANGLPRFAAPAEAANLSILDNFLTPKINVSVLYHGALPVIPFNVPTCFSIGTVLTKLALRTSTSDDCLAGLVRAIAVSFFHRGQGDLNCLVNAFAENLWATAAEPTYQVVAADLSNLTFVLFSEKWNYETHSISRRACYARLEIGQFQRGEDCPSELEDDVPDAPIHPPRRNNQAAQIGNQSNVPRNEQANVDKQNQNWEKLALQIDGAVRSISQIEQSDQTIRSISQINQSDQSLRSISQIESRTVNHISECLLLIHPLQRAEYAIRHRDLACTTSDLLTRHGPVPECPGSCCRSFALTSTDNHDISIDASTINTRF
ncbi:hypothetical protein GJ496_003707 [Pomphorhynchus laevis]|nr:hypothetical protein GJ496_003707 [Pomphorhynchus laevis]